MRRNRISRLALYLLSIPLLIGCNYKIGSYEIERKAFDSVSRKFENIARIYDENNDYKISQEEAERAISDFRGFINAVERSASKLTNLVKSEKPPK